MQSLLYEFLFIMGAPGGHGRRGAPKGKRLRRAKGSPGEGGREGVSGRSREGAPGGLHVFLEGEVVVGEVGVEVEFAEVYFFVIGGGVVRGILGGVGVIFLGGFL